MSTEAPAPQNGVYQRQVKFTPDHIVVGFNVMLGGMMAATLQQQVQPQVLVDQLLQAAARLMAGLQPDAARKAIAEQMGRNFPLLVESNAVAMQMTPGGVIVPKRNGG